jgi:DNA-binding CsgD family transcriptional regulator
MVRMLGAYLAGNLAESLLHLGEWPRVERVIARALRTRPEGVYGATLLDVAAQHAALTGRYEDAAARLAEATAMVGDHDDPQFAQPLAFTAALLLEHGGDRPAGLARLLGAVVQEPWSSPYAWPVIWLAARLQADLALDGAPPDPRIADLVAAIGDETAPKRAYVAQATAELGRATGTANAAEWLHVAELWRSSDWPHPHAYALHRAAERLAAEGDRARATRVLREAAAIATRLGAAPLLMTIAEAAAREHLPLDEPATVQASALERRLTSRELEVLRLLAAGRSNPQIAAELFISPKTASVHVSNILTKLEVATRVEAATLAQRSGLIAG